MEFLQRIVNLWTDKIVLAKQAKKKHFSEQADRIWKFYQQPTHSFFYDDFFATAKKTGKGPQLRMTVNKVHEFVALMLPYLHSKVPVRTVTPRRLIPPPALGALFAQNPQQGQMVSQQLMNTQMADELRSWLLQYVLNTSASGAACSLRDECRYSVTESITKGAGLVWHELVDRPDGYLAGSFYDTVDNLFIDPNVSLLREASFIVRKRRRAVWQVADEFGLPFETVRKYWNGYCDTRRQEMDTVPKELIDSEEDDQETCVYYEVFSRCGLGHRFVAADHVLKGFGPALDAAGKHIYLAILPGCPYPLNLPDAAMEAGTPDEEVFARLQWPIAFWGDLDSPWPFTMLSYYHGETVWPISPLKAGIPYQEFLNCAYSWLMTRIRMTGRDLIVASSALTKDLKHALQYGGDQSVIEYPGATTDLKGMLEVVQFPSVNRDAYEIINYVSQGFEKATGLTELMYGSSGATQPRSAAEVQIKQNATNIRPEDMAECVEAWQRAIAKKEGAANRLYVSPKAVSRMFGEDPSQEMPGYLSMLWANLVSTQDPYVAHGEVEYSVEAGSGRKKNRLKQLQDLQDASQTVLPLLMQVWQMTQDPSGINSFFREWSEARESHTVYQVPDLRMMQQPQQQQQGPPQQGGPQQA